PGTSTRRSAGTRKLHQEAGVPGGDASRKSGGLRIGAARHRHHHLSDWPSLLSGNDPADRLLDSCAADSPSAVHHGALLAVCGLRVVVPRPCPDYGLFPHPVVLSYPYLLPRGRTSTWDCSL